PHPGTVNASAGIADSAAEVNDREELRDCAVERADDRTRGWFGALHVGGDPFGPAHPLSRLSQYGTEQQARLAVDDPLNTADPREQTVERGEGVGAEIGDEIPSAVRGVQRVHFGKAAELVDDI